MTHAVSAERPPLVLHVLAPMREGGLERVVTMLAAGQRDSGVHVAAVLEPHDTADHPFVDRLKDLGVPVTVVAVRARNYFAEYRALRNLIASLRPQVVHTHGYRADIVGGAAARRGGIKHVSTVHGFTGGGAGLRNRMYETLQRLALRRSDAVIGVSAPLVERLAAAGVSRRRLHFVANGFVGPRILLDPVAARARLDLPSAERVLGWIGRLSSEKGADVMIDALALSDPAWTLSIIGEGDQLPLLRAQAEGLGVGGRIRWHGSIGEAASLISAFDAFILSSRTEGTPIVLFEAMYAGVPVVATAVGGVPDVVSDEHAILVPAERPDLIANALAQLLADPSEAARRAERARKRVADSFGHTAWIKSVERVYARVTGPFDALGLRSGAAESHR